MNDLADGTLDALWEVQMSDLLSGIFCQIGAGMVASCQVEDAMQKAGKEA